MALAASRPRSRSVRARRWLIALVVFAVIIAAHPLWLRWMGALLVHGDTPSHADMVVVLAGDREGNRIMKACQLVREGYAPRALVSGPPCCYDRSESDLAIEYAVHRGCPSEWFIPFPNDTRSTKAEAAAIVPELKRRGVRRFLLVTSDYHTRRAARAYRKLLDPAAFRTIAAPDKWFSARGWWHNREGQKTVFFEWSKTFASWVGL